MKGLRVACVVVCRSEAATKPSANGKPMVRFFGYVDETPLSVCALGELAECLLEQPPRKGESVYVEGSLTVSLWNGKPSCSVLASRVDVLGRFRRAA
jgi:hypothetical protein